MNFKKVKVNNPPIKDKVYTYLRDKIIKGEINSGDFIEEETITNETGFSRTPVREAFVKLEAERFIDLIPRKGARVRQVTGTEIINIYETRRLIEKHAAKRICEENIVVPVKMIDCHESMIERYEAYKDDLNEIDFYQHIFMDVAFHGSMVAAVNNPVLMDMYEAIQNRKIRVAYTALSIEPERIHLIIKEHTEILDSLLKRDVSRVVDALENHLKPLDSILSRLP
ncbi:GntR family transcriptional regulator [Marinomonas foliarum]|uniref:GntR family transcriptional regulator n=1 Tax=Marinomonas foliarum TaxID=491950 RepID=A0A368ZRM7_9GAMM|nr:GntR family transcriptional regulator [Marinomonas foliarum]RCW99642.1 GntR family transcriptional regulator [Marinomonas foliarum]